MQLLAKKCFELRAIFKYQYPNGIIKIRLEKVAVQQPDEPVGKAGDIRDFGRLAQVIKIKIFCLFMAGELGSEILGKSDCREQ
jgi:hypothetical protein